MSPGGWAAGAFAGGRPRPGRFAVRQGPRRSRRAVLVRAGAGLLSLALLGLLVWWLLNSATFAVTRVESGSYRFTSETELQDAFAGFLGANIWTLSTDDVAAEIGRLPWIRDVHVTRSLPNRIEVDFREWSPVLLVEPLVIDGVVRDRLVLREDGRLLEFPAHLVLPGLPVLVGVEPVREGEGPALGLPAAQSAQLLELISSMEDAGLEAAIPVDFVVARPEGFGIVLQNGEGTLLVGREDFGARLQRYMTARDHLEPGLDYDLRFKDRITVRARR